jgi:hypothetical protein
MILEFFVSAYFLAVWTNGASHDQACEEWRPGVTRQPQQTASLFDHLVGAGENRERQMRFNVLRQREFGASPGALFRFRGYGKISSMTQTIVRQ